MEVLIHGSVGNSMVTWVSPEQYREINEFGLSEQSRHWASFGSSAPMVNTNKQGFYIYVPTTNCTPSNRPVSDGEEEILARQV